MWSLSIMTSERNDKGRGRIEDLIYPKKLKPHIHQPTEWQYDHLILYYTLLSLQVEIFIIIEEIYMIQKWVYWLQDSLDKPFASPLRSDC